MMVWDIAKDLLVMTVFVILLMTAAWCAMAAHGGV
jgi:hypothetical protein